MSATEIMLDAHEGQKHGDGPYHMHPMAVARLLYSLPGFSDMSAYDKMICGDAALLHDVLEDSSWSAADLQHEGINDDVITTVILLTRSSLISDDDYYAAIRADKYAIWVKTADMCHNLSTLAHLSNARKVKLTTKYAKGMVALHG